MVYQTASRGCALRRVQVTQRFAPLRHCFVLG